MLPFTMPNLAAHAAFLATYFTAAGTATTAAHETSQFGACPGAAFPSWSEYYRDGAATYKSGMVNADHLGARVQSKARRGHF